MDQTIDLKIKKKLKLSAADRLLAAAGLLFADRPFDAVSTRALANAANVNLSAISYHFGNKEGLYEATFKKLLDELAPTRKGLSAFLEASLGAAENNPQLQREVVQAFVGMVIDTITSDENPTWRMRLMIREIQQSGRCFEMIMKEHINVIHDLVGRLVASITKQPAESADVKITSHSIIGLCLQYGLNEALLSSRMGWDGYGSNEVEFIKAKTATFIFAILGIANPTLKSESE